MNYILSMVFALMLLAGPVLAQTSGGQAGGQTNSGAISNVLYDILFITVLTGGFGGFVHGMLRQTAVHYKIRWPFQKGENASVQKDENAREFGFLGDILVGIAAAMALSLALDSAFLLNVQDLIKPDNTHAWLKFIAIGVIGGYTGVGVLDAFAIILSKKLAQDQKSLEETNAELDKARARLRTSKEATEMLTVARGLLTWKEWDRALEYYDAAIALEPNNPSNYVEKSFVYAGRAAQLEKGDDSTFCYETAVKLTEKAMDIDPSFGRAYYDRACYKNKLKKTTPQDILADLKKSIDLNPVHGKMAKYDPDLKDLRENEEFKRLVGSFESAPKAEQVPDSSMGGKGQAKQEPASSQPRPAPT